MDINNPNFFLDFGDVFNEYITLGFRCGHNPHRFKTELTNAEQQRFFQLYEEVEKGRDVIDQFKDILNIEKTPRMPKRSEEPHMRYVPVGRNDLKF